MSGDEQQMVAVGRALMTSPEIILLDEPSLGLAPIMCTERFGALARIRSTGVGILLVEQNARQSLKVADRGYLIESGRIVGSGTGAALKEDPAVQRHILGRARFTSDKSTPLEICHDAAYLPELILPAAQAPAEASERLVAAQGGDDLLAEQADRSHQLGLRQVREVELAHEDVEQARLGRGADFFRHRLGRADEH